MAAEQGDAFSQGIVGWMYEEGWGVPQNDKEALKWYRMGVEQGDARAQNRLGFMYQNGRGVNKDYKEALKWYRLAAEQGIAQAQLGLGLMYISGHGVPQSYTEAVKWYRLAAEQGDSEAQCCLGVAYERGEGVAQSYQKALKWYRLSASQGDAAGLSVLARLLATCRDPEFRDGAEAVRYALMAVEKAAVYQTLDTLAAAYARKGDFEYAVSNQTKAIAMVEADEDLPNKDAELADMKIRLEAYRNKKPWVEE
jgi:TPR repeat protein